MARPLRAGRGGWGGPARRAAGDPRPPPLLLPERASSPPPPGAETHWPGSCGRGDPRPAQSLPLNPLPTWARVRARGWRHGHGERSARARVPRARRRRRRRRRWLPLLPPPLPPPGSQAPDRSPPPRVLPAPPGARRAELGLRRGAERSRREPGCGAHCVKRGASAGWRRGPRAPSLGPAGQAGQRRRRRRRGAGRLRLRLRLGRGGGGRGSAEVVAHSF